MSASSRRALDEQMREERMREMAGAMAEELIEAANHFERIGSKALHWAKVFAHNDAAVGRWMDISHHANHRASVIRAIIKKVEAP